jgi:hypothetical protein
MASDEVCDCDSDPDLTSPARYCGEGGEGFGCGRGSSPIQQMIVDENAVEPLFLAELCALDYLGEGFVCGLEYSDSESDPALHPIVPEPRDWPVLLICDPVFQPFLNPVDAKTIYDFGTLVSSTRPKAVNRLFVTATNSFLLSRSISLVGKMRLEMLSATRLTSVAESLISLLAILFVHNLSVYARLTPVSRWNGLHSLKPLL